MTSEPLSRVGYRQALVSRELRALCTAQLVSVSGTSVAAVALTVLVYHRTASPLLASLSFSLAFLPYLIGGAALSSVVDRVRPRRLVTRCDAASAVVAAAMAWPAMPIAALLGLLSLIGALSSLANGSRSALVRCTVSEEAYVPARSLMRIAAQAAQIGGYAAAGVLLVVVSPSGAFLVNAGCFAVASAAVRVVVGDHGHLGDRHGSRVLGSLHGARAVLRHRELRHLLLIGWLAPMCAVAPEALAAPYIAAHHDPSSLVSWWLAALPIGLIAGDIAGVRYLRPPRLRRLVAPLAAAGLAPYLLFFADPAIALALPLLLVSGCCGLYGLGLDARVRDAAPIALFTRTMALSSAGLMALQGIGFTMAGAVAQAVGPAAAIGIAGASGMTAIIVLAAAISRSEPARYPPRDTTGARARQAVTSEFGQSRTNQDRLATIRRNDHARRERETRQVKIGNADWVPSTSSHRARPR